MAEKSASPKAKSRKTIASNRKAYFNYSISDKTEAGIVLVGSEVKSARAGKVNLGDAHAEIIKDELFLLNCHISTYEKANQFNHEPLRRRKLLLHRQEIDRLGVKITERGFTLVPLELYFSGGRVKVELGLGKGKQKHDKRQAIKERDQRRDLDRSE